MRTSRLRTLLIAGVVIAPIAGFAAGYDLDQVPAVAGTVARYTLTPRGDVDGLVLGDGTEVRFPPHLSAQLVYAVRPATR